MLVGTHYGVPTVRLAGFLLSIDEALAGQLQKGDSDGNTHQDHWEESWDLFYANLGDEDPDRGGWNCRETILKGVGLYLNLEDYFMRLFLFFMGDETVLEERE